MRYKYRHMYRGYLLERSGGKEYPWNIYRARGTYKVGPYAGTPRWEHVGFEKSLKDCRETINSGAIEMCDLMCPGASWND